MIYKEAIVNCCLSLLDVEERLRLSYYKRGNNYKTGDLIEFKVKLVKLFSLIRRMMKEKGIEQAHISIYNDFLKLEALKEEFNLDELMLFKNFLFYYLHKLNLTNLLLKGQGGFEDQFGKEYG